MPTHDMKKSGQIISGSVILARILPKGLNSEDGGQKRVRPCAQLNPMELLLVGSPQSNVSGSIWFGIWTVCRGSAGTG